MLRIFVLLIFYLRISVILYFIFISIIGVLFVNWCRVIYIDILIEIKSLSSILRHLQKFGGIGFFVGFYVF